MKVLYINYVNFDKTTSGSSVRPKKIFDAFKHCNYEVDMITGFFKKENYKERKDNIIKQIAKLDNTKYDFCYIEPPSGIICRSYNKIEFDLIKAVAQKNIPVGIFYRDIYWKFYKYFDIRGIKPLLIKIIMKKELSFLKKYCDVFFIPSEKMGDYLPVKNKVPLPPACEECSETFLQRINSAIYVGGTSKAYGTDILLEAMKIVNKSKQLVLNIVCRKSEMSIINDFIEKENAMPAWLKVYNVFGDELDAIYDKSDFAICSLKKIPYYDFCMPIKIYEYISHFKPIVATNCDEISKLITQNNLGLVVKDNALDLANGILQMSELPLIQYKDSIKKFREVNMWDDRVKEISQVLLSFRKS